jgi:Tol biopolymer transport system component
MRRRSRASRWPLWLALACLGGLAGLGMAAYLSLPRLVQVSPAPDAQSLSPRTRIRLTFNQPMNAASVEAALRIEPPVAGAFSWEGSTVSFAALEAWPLLSTVSVTLNGGQAQNGLPLLERRQWTFRIGRERVLFITGSPPNVHSIALLDENPEPITAEPFGVHEFTLSAADAHLVYSAARADGGADLRLIQADGAGAREVLACPEAACRQPALSPDGARLAYERQTLISGLMGEAYFGEPQVHVLTLATGADLVIGASEAPTRTPRWGPDGRLSVYDAARGAIAIYDLGGGVTYAPVSSGDMGSWSPDGLSLVYPEIFLAPEAEALTETLTETAPFYSHLLRVTVATNEVADLSGPTLEVEDASPAFSHNGLWLAFARKGLEEAAWTPGRQLWLMRADGSEARPLTDDPVYQHSAFAWSPDDQWIAFMRFNVADQTEPASIWIIRPDGSGGRRLVREGYLPAWLP